VPGRSRCQAAYLTAGMGIVHAVLLLLYLMPFAAIAVVWFVIGRHTRMLPAWFIWLGVVVGVFLLLAASGRPT
jgi:hypothetical protein